MAREAVSQNDIVYLRVFIEHPDPVLTATEVASERGVSQQGAHDKLQKLQDSGYVRSKKTGSRSRVWWITTDGREAYRESLE